MQGNEKSLQSFHFSIIMQQLLKAEAYVLKVNFALYPSTKSSVDEEDEINE